VDVLQASGGRLELTADGPISLDVRYTLRDVAAGSKVQASVSVKGRGLLGRVVAKATETLLAAGALQLSLRLARELRPAVRI
jgi:hypothetical protein